MFLAVADGLQSLEVNNCNDIFTPATFDYLPLLEQLTRLHIISCRQRFPARSFLGLAGIKGLQVSLPLLSFCVPGYHHRHVAKHHFADCARVPCRISR